MVPLSSRSLPLPSISLSLSLFPTPSAVYVPLFSFSISPSYPSLSPSLSRSLSLTCGFFSGEGTLLMVVHRARKPPAAASLPCCFSAFPFVSLLFPLALFSFLSLFLFFSFLFF